MIGHIDKPDPYEVAAEKAIAACDGDVRAALKAALIAMTMLERDVVALHASTSHGYARGKVRPAGDAM